MINNDMCSVYSQSIKLKESGGLPQVDVNLANGIGKNFINSGEQSKKQETNTSGLFDARDVGGDI